MGVEGDIEEVGRGLSLIVSIVITVVALVVIAGAGVLMFYKTKDESKEVTQDRRIAGGVLIGFSVIVIIVVWVIDWITRQSHIAAGIEGAGAVMAIV